MMLRNLQKYIYSPILLFCVSSTGLVYPVIAQEEAATSVRHSDSVQSTTRQPADKYADKLLIFEEFVREQMEKEKIPGLTIGFYKDDYTWVKGFGYADLENKVPAKPESAYRLASVTKPFTSAAILQLV